MFFFAQQHCKFRYVIHKLYNRSSVAFKKIMCVRCLRCFCGLRLIYGFAPVVCGSWMPRKNLWHWVSTFAAYELNAFCSHENNCHIFPGTTVEADWSFFFYGNNVSVMEIRIRKEAELICQHRRHRALCIVSDLYKLLVNNNNNNKKHP